MKAEELLKLLADNGVAKEEAKDLLTETLEALKDEEKAEEETTKDDNKPEEETKYAEDDEKRLAGKLLGVEL